MKKYRWSEGYYPPVTAEVAAQEFAVIEKVEGRVTPEAVIEAALPEDAPLHPAFDWDDESAANKWRLNQASKMVRHLRLVQGRGKNAVERRVFVRVREADGYVNVGRVEAEFRDALPSIEAEAIRSLEAFRDRFNDLASSMRFKVVFVAIDAVTGKEVVN